MKGVLIKFEIEVTDMEFLKKFLKKNIPAGGVIDLPKMLKGKRGYMTDCNLADTKEQEGFTGEIKIKANI